MLPVSKEELKRIIAEAREAGKDTKELQKLVRTSDFSKAKNKRKIMSQRTPASKEYRYVSTGPIREDDFK